MGFYYPFFDCVELAYRIGRRLFRDTRPQHERGDGIDVARSERIEDARAQMTAWANARRLVQDGDGILRGTLEGLSVEITPGLEGSAPRGLELFVATDLAKGPAVLVTVRTVSPGSGLELALTGLFEEPGLRAALRSVAITPSRLRLRFAPSASLEAVDLAARALASALHDVAVAQSGDAPRSYRG